MAAAVSTSAEVTWNRYACVDLYAVFVARVDCRTRRKRVDRSYSKASTAERLISIAIKQAKPPRPLLS